ncbi:MAG: energy transducer TonB [Opitutales bacterium]
MSQEPTARDKVESSYEAPRFDGRILISIVLTVLAGVAIFGLLPLTQLLEADPKDQLIIATVNVAPPPPPEPPETEEIEEPEETEEPPEPPAPPPPPLDLNQIELALNPGIASAEVSFGFGGFDVAEDMISSMDLFDVTDLDEEPRVRRMVRVNVPMQMKRDRVGGEVKFQIIIAADGRVEAIEKVVEATNRRLIEPAREALTQYLFTPPTKNGQKVRARYIYPFVVRIGG